MEKNSKIFVAGHRGLVGSNIVKQLQENGYQSLILKTHQELDLKNQQATADFFIKEKPEYVFLAAAYVGGILANNTYRADFIYTNLQIQNNVIHNSYVTGVKKLLFLGSSCIYPKLAPQPIKEDSLLSSELEYTNEPYAIAKIAGLKMCESYNLQYKTNFIAAMPTNLYGIEDNFDLEKSHVIPALIKKIHLAKLLSQNETEEILSNLKLKSLKTAKEYLLKFGVTSEKVAIWGSGSPKREFLYAKDLANACLFLMKKIDFTQDHSKKEIRNTQINIGSGVEISIKELALLIKQIIGFKGELYFDKSKPDGTFRKLTSIAKIKNLGWVAKTSLKEGIRKVYLSYKKSSY